MVKCTGDTRFGSDRLWLADAFYVGSDIDAARALIFGGCDMDQLCADGG